MDKDLMILFSSIGAINSLALAGLLYFFPIGSRLSNKILAALMLLLSLKIGKTLLIFTYNVQIDIAIIGVFAFYCIGPTLYIYIQSFREDFTERHFIRYLLHYLFPIVNVLFILRYIFRSHSSLWSYTDFLLLLYYLYYWIISIKSYYKIRKVAKINFSIGQVFIIKSALIATLVLWISLLLHSILKEKYNVLLGPIVYSIILYFTIIYLYKFKLYLKQNKIIKKYATQNLTVEEKSGYINKLLTKIEEDKLFLVPDINLNQLSESLNIKQHILSRIINEHFKVNFSDFINTYRINYCCQLMKMKDFKNYKISILAYESGFNSLSVFNNAFKKLTKTTPKKYRENIEKRIPDL